MALTQLRGRLRVLVLAVLIAVAAALAQGAALASPGQPSQTISMVTAKLDALAHEAKDLAVKFAAAQRDLRTKELQATVATKTADQAARGYRDARAQLTALVTAQYEHRSVGQAGALLAGSSAERFVDELNMMQQMSSRRAALLSDVSRAAEAAAEAEKDARSLAAEAHSRLGYLEKQRAKILDETTTYRYVLASLTAAQQRAYQATSGVQNGSGAVAQASQCAQQPVTGVGGCGGRAGYINPFAGQDWTADRTDQGVDWEANVTEPVRAIGDGVITYSNSNQPGWPENKFIVYGLTSGDHAGLYIFVAENLTDLLPVGTIIKAGQPIATALPGGTGIEMGFAAPPGTGPNVATPYNGASDGTQTEGGKAFARFLIELGAKPLQPPGPGPDRP